MACSIPSRNRPTGSIASRVIVKRPSPRRRGKDTDTNLLELLALGRRLDVLEVDQGVLAEVHDLPQIVEEALVALEALEELDERLGADLLVVPAEIENKTTPGIVR